MSDLPGHPSVSPSGAPSAVLQKSLWSLTWPLLWSTGLNLALTFFDAIFLGRISDRAAGAVGALLPALGVTIMLFAVVAQAGSSVAGQLLGARRNAEVPATYLALVLFNGAIGITVSAVFFLLRGVIVGALGLEGDMAEYARTYLGMVGGFQFIKALQIGFSNIVNSRGQTRWTMAEAVLTNISNVTLNLAFVAGAFGAPKLGVFGSALATVLSLALGLCFTVLVVRYRLKVRLPYRSTSLGELRARLRPILEIALPASFEPISYQLTQMVLNARVVALGPAVLAARVYAYNLYLMSTILWAVAFGLAGQIAVAHRIGAGLPDAADKVLHRALLNTVVGNLALCGTLAVTYPWLFRGLTHDPAVVAAAAPVFLVAPFVEFGRAGNIVAGGALRAAGDARFTASIGLGIQWLVGVPLALFLSPRVGLAGIWISMAADEMLRGIMNYLRWRHGGWRTRRSLIHPATEVA
jgi:putative MATE family efflux protein